MYRVCDRNLNLDHGRFVRAFIHATYNYVFDWLHLESSICLDIISGISKWWPVDYVIMTRANEDVLYLDTFPACSHPTPSVLSPNLSPLLYLFSGPVAGSDAAGKP